MGNRSRPRPTSGKGSAAPPRTGISRRWPLIGAGGAVVVVAIIALFWIAGSTEGGSTPAAKNPARDGQSRRVTPIIAGTATGTASAAGVEVSGASVDFGRVPLDTAVEQKFVLRNTGIEPVSLGKAKIEVLEGC